MRFYAASLLLLLLFSVTSVHAQSRIGVAPTLSSANGEVGYGGQVLLYSESYGIGTNLGVRVTDAETPSTRYDVSVGVPIGHRTPVGTFYLAPTFGYSLSRLDDDVEGYDAVSDLSVGASVGMIYRMLYADVGYMTLPENPQGPNGAFSFSLGITLF